MGNKKEKDSEKLHRKWVMFITIFAFFLSVFMSYFSDMLLSRVNLVFMFVILICIILLGILFDIIGVAVTVADEKPFHSMASSKVKGAKSALMLIRNASRVSNVCNDVIGDICGIVSGASSAYIVLQIGLIYPAVNTALFAMTLSGMVASLTIGGKAFAKETAISQSKKIVTYISKIIAIFKERTN